MLIPLTLFFLIMFICGILLGRWNKKRERLRLERKIAQAEERVYEKIEAYEDELLEVAKDQLAIGSELSSLNAAMTKIKANQAKARKHKARHQERWLHWQVVEDDLSNRQN